MSSYYKPRRIDGSRRGYHNKSNTVHIYAKPATRPQPHYRLVLLFSTFVLWGGVIVYRLYSLQAADYFRWSAMASKQHATTREIESARGDITDRLGRRLAVSLESFAVGFNPSRSEDLYSTVEELAVALKVPQAELLRLVGKRNGFTWLYRGLSAQQVSEIIKSPIDGVVIDSYFRRYYPHGSMAAPVLGRVGRDGGGLAGIELAYDDLLRVEHNTLAMKRDARGRVVRVEEPDVVPDMSLYHRVSFVVDGLRSDDRQEFHDMSRNAIRTTYPIEQRLGSEGSKHYRQSRDSEGSELRSQGEPLALTIDAAIQGFLEEELEVGAKNAGARYAFGVILDADSGDILAISQSSRFDPNDTKDVGADEMRNVPIQDVFEPGSTLKPIVMGFAIDEGVVSLNELIDCEGGSYHVAGHTIRDVHPSGVSSIRDVLVHSSNIGMLKIGLRLGKHRMYQRLRDIGFGRSSGVEIPGEGKGLLRSLADWKEIDTVTSSFGQGLGVTVMQMVQAYAAIANGGYQVTPRLVMRGQHTPTKKGKRVFSEKTVRFLKDSLRGVVEDERGTGRKAAIEGFRVYGKTGTAQKARSGGRGYDPDKVQASFVGFIDVVEETLNRRLVVAVTIDEPSVRPRFGGVIAAPVFKNTVTKAIDYLRVTQSGAISEAVNKSINESVNDSVNDAMKAGGLAIDPHL